MNIHGCIHGMGFKHTPQALKEIRTYAIKQLRASDVHADTRLNETILAKGIKNVSYYTPENVMQMKINQTSSVFGDLCLCYHSKKIYRQSIWMRPLIVSILKLSLKRKKKILDTSLLYTLTTMLQGLSSQGSVIDCL
jgi:large subunit ribosomal protein L31e